MAIFINFALPVKDEDVTSAFAGGVVKSSRFFDWLFLFPYSEYFFVNLQCLEDVRTKWLSPALHFPDFLCPYSLCGSSTISLSPRRECSPLRSSSNSAASSSLIYLLFFFEVVFLPVCPRLQNLCEGESQNCLLPPYPKATAEHHGLSCSCRPQLVPG